jgi:asparaginyl-tRNA synthetase
VNNETDPVLAEASSDHEAGSSSRVPSQIHRIDIRDAGHHVGEAVRIYGWLYNLRKSGKIVFPIVRDGSGMIQCVAVKSNLPEQVFDTLKNLTQESSVVVTGKIRAEARATGGFELDVEDAEVLQRVSEENPYPITPKEHGVDFLMDHRHLWLRSRRQHAAIRVRHEVIKAIRDYFDSHGFTLVDTPIFTPAACEGTTTLFEVDYFEDEKVYLTQSGQLYNEANAMAFGKVYCFGPTFRAEKSKTRRHLTEFWMVEPEMAYADLEDVKNVAEELIAFVVARVLENRAEDLKTLERDINKLEAIKGPFPRMSYDEAVKILAAKGSEIKWGGDFGNADETLLTEDFDRPVIVDRYPTEIKGFYFQPDSERPELALGVDIIAPEGYGEIVGGGQRIHDLALLERRLHEHNLPAEAFNWYLDLRRFGSVPHAGFGMGVERFVAWMCGLEHVRETIAYPRMLYRTRP